MSNKQEPLVRGTYQAAWGGWVALPSQLRQEGIQPCINVDC